MRKTKLSKRDVEICLRLRDAREHLGISQEKCARQIGLERSTLLNYEHCRTPLRFEIALRFCRQFIVSEEWLATGRHDACHAEGPRHGMAVGSGLEMASFDKLIFFRQCVDLLSDPRSLHIAPGTLFGEAYDKTLALEYARLVHDFYYLPRIVLSDSDNAELVCNLLNALNERFMVMLGNEALRRGQKQNSAWRVYARCMLESADLVFRKMMRFPLDPQRLNDLGWLRYCITDPNAIIPFMRDETTGLPDNLLKSDLTNTESSGLIGTVKAQMPELLGRIKQAASASGKKTELANYLKAPLASVSRWLSGEREPGGEIALQMDAWATGQGYPKRPSNQK